jgi:hypothetical protein
VPSQRSPQHKASGRRGLVTPSAGAGDWILGQVTGNPYGDPGAVQLMVAQVATLSPFARDQVINA